MALGDVIFNAKLNTQPLEKEVKKVERMKVKSPFGKFKEDFTFFSAGFKASAQQMKDAQKEVLGYSKAYEDLVEQGKAFKDSMDSMIGGPTLTQQEDFQKLSEKIKQAEADMKEATNYMKHAEKGFGAKNLFGKVFGKLRELGAKVLEVGKSFIGLGKSAKGAGNSITHGMGQGIRRMLGMVGAGALLYKTFQYVREGMNNLIAYDKNTANSVNTLKNALTALKNALASAFAPILNTIAPILAKFIGMLTSAANAVASFLSALLGKKFTVVASNVAGGLDGIGSSASGANDSANELKRTLMGFDKINKLDSNSGGGSGGGGGGGAGGGGGGFDLVPVGDEANQWADKFKESWEKADFTWFGELLATKLNNALAKIPWDKINATLERIAKSIATFLNGFIGKADWELVGKTIGEGIKSALNFLNTFFTAIEWEKIGKAIVKFFAGIDWVGIFKASVTLLGNIASAIMGVFRGAINEAHKKLKEWITSDKIWSDLLEIGKTTLKITIKLLGDGAKLLKDFFGTAYDIAITLIGSGLQKLKDWLFGAGKTSAEVSLVPKFSLPSGVASIAEAIYKLNPLGNTIEFVAKLVSWIKSFSSNEVGGMTAEFSDKKKGSGFSNVVGSMTAEFSDKKKGGGFANNIGGMIAELTGREKGKKFDSTLSGMTAKFTSVNQKSLTKKQKTINVTAKVTKLDTVKLKGTGVRLVKAEGGVYKNGKWSPIERYAEGGMPNGSQLFWAREKGPELVGTLGGHTAVMNNDQIVASVSSGVAKAIAGIRFKMSAPKIVDASPSRNAVDKAQESADISNKQVLDVLTQILSAINNKDFKCELDGREISRSAISYINNETRRTGTSPLLI